MGHKHLDDIYTKKPIAKNATQSDWVSVASRRVYNWGSGVGKFIKRSLNRRLRRAVKKDLREQQL